MKQILFSISVLFPVLFFFAGCNTLVSANEDEKDFSKWVDPMIGSAGHGHVFVGANVPHGMVQLGPNNLSKGWDWSSGYHYSDSTIVGFAHTHLSGTGIADLGDILFQPITGSPELFQGDFSDLTKGFVSKFQRINEIVRPGYYSVLLDKYDIKAELTSTERVGYHRYLYPKDKVASIIVDMHEGAKSLNREGTLEAWLRIVNDTTIEGYRISNEWASDHRVYFTTRFSSPITSYKIQLDSALVEGREATGRDLKAILRFENAENNEVLVKTGISYTSIAASELNLSTEGATWDFDLVAAKAKDKWDESLSVIRFYHPDNREMRIFYTALYHLQFSPSVFDDVDGAYRGADGKIYSAGDFTPYTIFSLWDTYRAMHPLATIIDKRTPDYVNSLLAITKQQGRLPVWHLVGNETDAMVGVHSIPVMVDAALKGIDGVDKDKIYNAIVSFETRNERGLKAQREMGYIPADQELWSVAKGLEYAIDDYGIAMLAKNLGKMEEYEKYLKRSKSYAAYFDASVGFMRGKLSDGSWRENFNPFHSIHLEDDYVEGNAWQYTWLVPHDVDGLIGLFGDERKFINKLDSLFLVSSELNEGASIDITGMIGQYAHGNEPSHHILYLYAFAGEQWKTAEKVRQVMDQFYLDDPDGLIGNEDCGQMSAWYIFSALGFYPVNPVNGIYVFGSPIAEKATLQLLNGKSFTVKTKNNSKINKYIQSATLNGSAYEKIFITHEEIMMGGELVFTMGPEPNKLFTNKTDSGIHGRFSD